MMRNRLNQILDAEGLSSRMQAIVELGADGTRDSSLYGVECLTRGPAGTVFESANVLFDYTRRKHAEVIIDRECIALALRNARVLASNVRLFMNVHGSTLGRDAWFVRFLEHQAEANGLDLRRVTLEILEHSGHSNQRVFLQNVRTLQSLGVSIALDDVGLHYCNFGMLLDVVPAYLKLDMQLVRGCHTDPRRQAILRSIKQIGLDVGAKVIAEGVEGVAELEIVEEIGIRYIQGYYFHAPMRPEEFLKTPWNSAPQLYENRDRALAPALLMQQRGAESQAGAASSAGWC